MRPPEDPSCAERTDRVDRAAYRIQDTKRSSLSDRAGVATVSRVVCCRVQDKNAKSGQPFGVVCQVRLDSPSGAFNDDR